MRNLLVTLRFDGRTFHGWQVQKNAPTVMETFQNALEALLGERPDVKGCSRTDSGVSAAEYCVSFRSPSRIPCERIVPALNGKLPPTVVATDCREVGEGFHARYSCTGKRYRYRILNTSIRDPFWDGFALHWRPPINVARLDWEAKAFVGTHDFAAFKNAGSDIGDTVRTIFDCSVTRHDALVELAVSGDGFLYNMVRIMVGTLLELDRGTLVTPIPALLEGGDRTLAGMTAPARGLLLERVFYEQYEN